MTPLRAWRSAGIDLRPLSAGRDFRLVWSGQLVSLLGRQITAVALPFQIYLLTGSTLAIGLLGLARLAPLVLGSILGGVLADRVDRKFLLIASNSALGCCSAGLALAAWLGTPPVWVLVLIAAGASLLGTVDYPARNAVVPNLVPRELLPAAVALNLALFHAGTLVGPVAGGLLIGRAGLPAAYASDAATYVMAVATLIPISRQRPASASAEAPLASIVSGLRHLRDQRTVIGTLALDLNAMVLGMPRALFPALALHTFHAGATGLGLLYAAPAAGGIAALATSGWVRKARRLGRIMAAGVAVWGLAIALAGLSHDLATCLVLLAVAGGADAAAVVCRSSLMQLETPDEQRGRVSAAYAIVGGGGPYLGDLESGTVGSIFTPAIAFVSGGVACAVVAGGIVAAIPELWRYRTSDEL